MGFLDIRPKNKGNTLVIPKKHYRWLWDVEEDYSKPANKVANALKKAFDTDMVVSHIIGDEVPHAHIHLIPRFENDGHGVLVDITKIKEFSSEEMIEIAEKIRKAIK